MKALWSSLESIQVGDVVECGVFDNPPVWMTVTRIVYETEYITVWGSVEDGSEDMAAGSHEMRFLVQAKGVS